MSPASNDLFYSRLPVNQILLSELLVEEHLFYKVPENWHVLITDVKKSTEAVANGLHETVNLVATGSIVAVMNIAHKAGISVPFFFGGDGATFMVPPLVLDEVLAALLLHQQNTQRNFNLALRVGQVPVTEIYAEGHSLHISKLRTSELFSIPVVLGNGLAYAEKKIKGDAYRLEKEPAPESELDLSGMQCRWDRIRPPENYDEVLSLLVMARNPEQQREAFRRVMEAIDRIYGSYEKRIPISISRLKLKTSLAKIGREMRVRMGGFRLMYFIRTWFTTLVGRLYFRTKKGNSYLVQLVNMSDTLVIDGRINTVISGTTGQREQLEAVLNELEQSGLIRFGFFVSRESIISCYVRNLDQQHIHFVDGSDGGYTRAATVLKRKLGVAL